MRNTGAMSSAVSLCTSSGSGQARGSSSAASGVQESGFNRMKTDLQEAAEAEGPPRLKLASSSKKRSADPPLHSRSYDHFERQSGAWCGMHALNNLLRGPMVNKEACRLAARRVRDSLGGADLESAHLDPQTGFLSILAFTSRRQPPRGKCLDTAPCPLAPEETDIDVHIVHIVRTFPANLPFKLSLQTFPSNLLFISSLRDIARTCPSNLPFKPSLPGCV